MTIVAESTQTVEFDAALLHATRDAKAAYPTEQVRIEHGLQIAIGGGVTLQPDGSALVQSQTQAEVQYRCNGHCTCEDAVYKAPGGRCQHRWGVALVKKALKYTAPPVERRCPECLVMQVFPGPVCDFCAQVPAVLGDGAAPVVPSAPTPVGIAPEHIVQIKGRPYVTYQGLLLAAHAQGLQRLEARFVSVTSDLALAEALAVFVDGRVFREAADATPGNVGAQVRPHFARMALVRAKARALRDALGATCAVEELGELA